MSRSNLTIGVLASQTRTNVPTIRYYAEIGLLPRAQRASNGHRHYRDADFKRLSFIKRCRNFGFPIEEVREPVALFEDGDRECIEVRDMAHSHLNAVREKLNEMRQLDASLAAYVAICDENCCAGPSRGCAIIEELSAIELVPKPAASGCCGSAREGIFDGPVYQHAP
ncbi:MerR family DNA-binding protein [Actimicrobium sp. GrIS 1.19]|uniref:MerR family DNA-binding protein n=1 Tax=Actimicrobium sp. GrIS 1.19 TaxID=3071708 RepID=UPI003FA3B584